MRRKEREMREGGGGVKGRKIERGRGRGTERVIAKEGQVGRGRARGGGKMDEREEEWEEKREEGRERERK